MPVITYPSSYSPNVNHHSISSAGHTLPKYSSANSSSLNGGSAFRYRTYNVNNNSSKAYSTADSYSRQLNGFRDYNSSSKSSLSTSSLTSNYLPNKTRSLNISTTAKTYGTSGSLNSLSSTPRSSISGSHSPTSTSSSSSSNGSISSYNNSPLSGNF